MYVIYHFHLSEPIFRFLCKQCGSRSASFFRSWLIRIYTVCHTTYAVLHSLVDMKMTYFHLLKVASDGNSYLHFGENYWHLANLMLNFIPATMYILPTLFQVTVYGGTLRFTVRYSSRQGAIVDEREPMVKISVSSHTYIHTYMSTHTLTHL